MNIEMEYEKIEQLIDSMGNSKLTELNINFPDGTKISMKKDSMQEKTVINKVVDVKEEFKEEIKLKKENIVTSPMVGTFYIKPSPTAEPYVEIGKTVKKGDVLCIIEAMKLMNEIECEFSGAIAEILVNDGDPVEYGTPLFKLSDN